MHRSHLVLGCTVAAIAIFSVSAPASAQMQAEHMLSDILRPTYLTAPAGDARLFITEQLGAIRIVENGQLLPTPFLDLNPEVPNVPEFDERGLVGLAFHPDYDQNGYFYVSFYNNNDESVVRRYTVSGNPNIANAASGFDILVIDQPHTWHNLNTLAFGPLDGYLYISLGDGGPSGDPNNYAQNLGELYGSVLRIDVDGGSPYGIPPDNPFIPFGGARNEIWVYGLRNPYRISLDRLNGDLYIGDVGQDNWEEVNYEPASNGGGANFGWRRMEGPDCYLPPTGCNPSQYTAAVHEYTHGGNPFRCAVTAGAVYRGSAIPEVQGLFFFADWCSAKFWSIEMQNGNATNFTDWTNTIAPSSGPALSWVSAICEDAAGELYILTHGANGAGGELYKLVSDNMIAVEDVPAPTLPTFRVSAAQPNPFAGATGIDIELAEAGAVLVSVFDASGRLVAPLLDGALTAGTTSVNWDGRDAAGRAAPSGIYFLRVETRDLRQTRRVVLVR